MYARTGRIFLVLVVWALAVGLDARAEAAAQTDSGSRIAGRVLMADGKSAAAGARVLAYHLFSERTFESAPTDARGRYELTGLPQGYFDIAVRTEQGLYVIEQVVGVPEEGEAALSLVVGAAASASSSPARRFAGLDESAVGIASVIESVGGGGSFLRSKSGLALIGAGVVGLAALGGGGGGGGDSSPSVP